MTLKQLRKTKQLTQVKCAEYLGVPIRTYQLYEHDENKCPSLKLQFIRQRLNEYDFIDEENGILSVDKIISACKEILPKYNAKYCYLFGSYAKGRATGKSDVDLLISAGIGGLAFYELVEVLRERLHKKVELVDVKQLAGNVDLINEILTDGIKIYG